jgi:adenosylcobinamide-GDP ribazoletransferase
MIVGYAPASVHTRPFTLSGKAAMPLLVAWTFLTALPIPLGRTPNPKDHGAAVAWYPAVGFALGGLLALMDRALQHTVLSSLVVAVLLVAMLALLTGFLHLDGLVDTCDAAFAHRPRQERLVIARDPRAGAFGVVSVVLLILLKVSLLAGSLGPQRAAVLVCFPALARCVMAAAVATLPAARGPEGMGGSVKAYARPWALGIAAALALIPIIALLRWYALVLCAGAVIGGASIAIFALRRLGGTTGDVYGAICECAEVGALLAAALVV